MSRGCGENVAKSRIKTIEKLVFPTGIVALDGRWVRKALRQRCDQGRMTVGPKGS